MYFFINHWVSHHEVGLTLCQDSRNVNSMTLSLTWVGDDDIICEQQSQIRTAELTQSGAQES